VFAWFAEEEKQPVLTEPAAPPTVSHQRIFPTTSLWLWFVAAALAFSLRDFAGASMGTLSSLFLQKAHGYDTKLAGLALSVLFIASVISNPLFGHLSDSGRKRWTAFVTMAAALLILLFPHLPAHWLVTCLAAYGFFFMVEAELMQSVPDAVRGRVFGLFITVGGLVGNLSHWIAGMQVKRMGAAAQVTSSYFWLYNSLAALALVSLAGLACLHAIRKREHLEEAQEAAATPITNRPSPITESES
jgi:MFS family permease